MKHKYQAAVLKHTAVHLNAETGEVLPADTRTYLERLLGVIYNNETRITVDTYSKVATVSSSTKKLLEIKCWDAVVEYGLGYDFSVYIYNQKNK